MLSLALLLISTGTVHAEALGTEFTYQGRLTEDGNPVNQSCDLQFSLHDASSAGSQVGSTLTKTSVSVSNGLFSVLLDFGANAFAGDARWLNVSVRCPGGSGSYTALSPRQKLTATPYALNASTAPWSGLTGVPAGFSDDVDNDTTYTQGFGLTLTGTVFSANTGDLQQRVTSTCAAGSSMRVISADGTVACEADTDTDTTYSAGSGFILTGTVFSANTGDLQQRVTSTCAAGSSMRVISADGTVACETDDDTDTTYTQGFGLTLTGTVFSANTGDIQDRVTGTCAAGSSMRVISADGTVACETDTDTDTDTTYTAGSGLTLTSTTFAVNTGDIQQRITATCSTGNAIRVVSADGTVACQSAGGGGGTSLLDADSDTKVQVEESADEDKIRFDTAGTERMIISGDTVGIGTSTPDASALVEIASTSKGMLLPRMTTTQRDAIASPATGLEIYNTTTNKFNYYNGTNWTAVGVGTNRFIHAKVGGTLVGVGTNSDIVFGTKIVGNGITLNTTTGVFTLTAGATYELEASIYAYSFSASAGNLRYEWVDSSNTSLGGTQAQVFRSDSTASDSGQPLAKLIITPSSDQQVKLRVISASGTATVHPVRSFASITQINSSGSDLITTSYIHANLSSSQTSVGANTDIVFNSELAGSGITLNTSTGVFTLPANGTYELEASLLINPFDSASGEMQYQWVDSSNVSLGGSTAVSEPVGRAINVTSQPIAKAIVTTTSSTKQVKLRTSGVNGTGNVSLTFSYARITQIGTSEWLTGTPFLQDGNSLGELGVLGSNDNYGLSFETNATERLRITKTGDVGIGTTSPDASALMELASTAKGLLIPRMTTTQRDAISSPATGLEIYNTTTNKFNFYNGTSWTEVGSGSGTSLLDADSDTKVQVEESSDEDKIRFDTAGTERMIISGDGNVGIGTSSPSASALLELSSTSKGMLLPRMTTTQRDAIASPATGLEIYNTTTNKFNYYTGTNWTAVGVGTNRYIHAKLSANVASVGSGTDIVFNTKIVGNGITLNTGSGVFTLTAGATYELDGALLVSSFSSASGQLVFEWVDSANASLGGTKAVTYRIDAGVNISNQPIAKLIITPSSDQQVKLRVTDGSGTGTVASTYSYASITQINSSGSDLITTSYIHAKLTGDQTSVSANTDIVFDTELAGSRITLNTSTGVFTLPANGTYELEASLYVTSFSATNSFLLYEWVDSGDTSLGGNTAISISVNHPSNLNEQTVVKAIVTTTSSTKQVKLRVIGAGGTGSVRAGSSFARITQIGTSEWLTGIPFLQDGNSLGELGVMGANDNFGLSFETNATERLRITETGDVGIGTSTPSASALLELSSTTKGMLVPRMTTTQRDAVASPATGLMVYNTTTNAFNFYNGASWTAVGSGLSTATLSSASTLSVSTEYHTDTSSAAFTATLPSAPADGSHIRIVDVKATFDTNNLTVNRGGSDTIQGSTSLTLSSENGVFDFHYDSGETRWSLAEHDTPAPVTLHQARMTRSTAQSIPTATNTKVTLNSEDFDTGGIADTSTGTVTITQAGRYLLNGSVCFTEVHNAQAQIWVGSTTVTRQYLAENNSAIGSWCANATAVQDLSVNDTVNLYVFQGSGANANTLTTNGDEPFLEVIQLPTAVVTNVAQASEYVYAQLQGAQTTNVAQDDHVKFSTVVESSGTSVTLDTSTTYTTTAGAASIGRFTLKGGKTYRLSGGVPWHGGGGLIRFAWYDATNGAYLSQSINVETTTGSAGGAGAVVTPTADTLVELRINSISSTSFGNASGRLYPWAIIETIADGTQVAQFTAATSSAAGTSGFIPKPESGDQGALLLGNSDWTDPATELFVDTSNNRVGIGTSTPASALHITPATAAALQIDPFGASSGELGELRFLELAANGTNYVGLQGPDLITGDVIWTLPNADGTDGQALVTDGSGALSWATAGGGTDLKDADSDTKVQVEESADEDRIRFDTAGSERMIISGDTVGIGTTTPSGSALLELSSTSKGMLIPRMTMTQRDAIASPATGLEIYNTTDGKFNYYNGASWTAVGVGTNRFIHAKLSADQTSVGASTDLIFATTIVGNGISLNASTGVFTLTAGATYELDAALWASAHSTANGLLIYEWVDSSNVSLGGTEAAAYRIDGSVTVHNQVLAKLIITPSSDQEVKLRVTSSTGTASVNARFSYASITQINSSGSDLITTSYIHAKLSAAVAGVGANSDIVFNSELAGSGITLDTSTGIFTLKANRTYELEASLLVIPFSAASGILIYGWVDSGDASLGGSDAAAYPLTYAGDNRNQQSVAKAIITPSSDTQVKLRALTGSSGTATVRETYSYARITQIGTSEWLTGTPFLQDGNSLGERGVLGANDNYGLSFETNATERLRITKTGDVGIGTTSPDGTLHVHPGSAGTVDAHANADDLVVENSASGGISVLTPDASTSFLLFGSASDQLGALIQWKYDDNQMAIATSKTGAHMNFFTGNTVEAMRIDSSGNVGIGTTSPGHSVHIKDASTNSVHSLFVEDTNATSNSQNIAKIATNTSNASSWSFLFLTSDNDGTPDQEFVFRGDGTGYADTSWEGGGADYAEWFEKEGDVPDAAVIGLNLETGKVRVWQPGDPLIGVQSTNPGFVGNNIDGAETDHAKMRETHALVALMGQVRVESTNTIEEGRKVLTEDGQFIGWRLADGKVFAFSNYEQAADLDPSATVADSASQDITKRLDALEAENAAFRAAVAATQAGSAPLTASSSGPISWELALLMGVFSLIAMAMWTLGRRVRPSGS